MMAGCLADPRRWHLAQRLAMTKESIDDRKDKRTRLCIQSMKGQKHGCLVDRGANGCIVGSDVTVLDRTDDFIDLTGIEDHTVRKLNLVHAAFVAKTHLGEVIVHIYQGAYMPDGKSTLAPPQIEAHGGTVCDKAKADKTSCRSTRDSGRTTSTRADAPVNG